MFDNGHLIRSVNLKITENNTIYISILPHNYENLYLWNSLMEDILCRITYSKQVKLSFVDEQLYNIFVGFTEDWIVKPRNDQFDIFFNFCNKRIINELIYGYDFFDYSYAFSLTVKDYKNEYRISPLGDNLGIEIKCSVEHNSILPVIENVCNDYDVILERKQKNE